MITIWHGMTIQGLYCYLDMGNNTVMYYKCSHVPNLVTRLRLCFGIYVGQHCDPSANSCTLLLGFNAFIRFFNAIWPSVSFIKLFQPQLVHLFCPPLDFTFTI